MKYYDLNDDINKEGLSIIAEGQNEKMAALGQLSGGIAHDYNNHLMSIIGNATMIKKTNELDKIYDYAERIIHISQSAAELTKKILMFSKKKSSINRPVNLKRIMDNTYKMMEFILSKEIDLIYSYDANDEVIVGDESQLESMLVNIILNSKDAIKNNGIIKIGTKDTVVYSEMALSHDERIQPGEYIQIYVEDNGSGIDDDMLQRIFEPYFSTKTKTNGTGLGLSVVFGTVKSHSGYLNVISKPGDGTRFEIFIPILKKYCIPDNRKITEDKNNNVMLVDDDINVLDVEAEMLEDLGYDVVKFNVPIEALKYYQERYKEISFSVVDIIMPGMNGKELFEKMELINKEAVVVFITGFAQQAEYEELMKRGLLVIEKPFTYEVLSEKIAKLYL
ncbi:MAG: response regulator [Tissierellia bacterium]|jgi:nitrogen-specific signal transduction histidine kinase|nr:response regulator [Tissierellia bacterium]